MSSRRWVQTSAISIALSALVFTWLVTDQSMDLFRSTAFSNFYDLQARALMHGHWNVSSQALWIEGIRTNGLTYMYYGPVPALLRMPVLLFTSRLDGRLTGVSLLLAFMVALVFVSRLSWKLRLTIRGSGEVGWGEAWVAGAWTAVIGLGSVLLYLSSSIQVYHEAELWGAALTIGAFDAILGFVMHPSRWRIATAGGMATLAIMTRGSVGVGPVVTLGLLAVGHGAVALWRRAGGGSGADRPFDWLGIGAGATGRTRFAGLTLATAVPVVLYAVVNEIKFRTLFSLPLTRQVYTADNAHRRAVLAANHGSLFGLEYIPTGLLAYLRPDALRFSQLFPFVTFPGPATLVGHVIYDTRDWSSSAPVTMPALMITAVIGLVALVRPKNRELAGLRLLVVGAAVSTIGVLTIAYIANRYLADVMPLVVLLSLIGFHRGWCWWRRSPRWLRTITVVAMTGLATFAVWVNAGLSIVYEHELVATIPIATRSQLVSVQARWAHFLFGHPPHVTTVATLPQSAPPGALDIVGSCQGVYQFDGHQWYGVELSAEGGAVDLQMRFPVARSDGRLPVVVTGSPGDGEILAVSELPDDQAQFWYRYRQAGQSWWAGSTFPVVPGHVYDVALGFDARVQQITAVVDGTTELDLVTQTAFHFLYPVVTPQHVMVGSGPAVAGSSTRFNGTIVRQKVSTPLCTSLLPHS